jgi:hypothetical protein
MGQHPDGVDQQPPAFIGWFFVVFASIFILLSWTLAVYVLPAGRFIARRNHHTVCFVLAGARREKH